ncbi:hypothetical protein ACPOL_3889 [Acidisarcina polymorpha]|uniref:Uncharacterized protein n=1 Tax=Acidisarcina polymorpha TaxID=2211140 RepID=A0A2Z5G266_9BACT|nr:hypothetical protein ACPOL_3889 [Acidisarcina polymorpha]
MDIPMLKMTPILMSIRERWNDALIWRVKRARRPEDYGNREEQAGAFSKERSPLSGGLSLEVMLERRK